MTPLKDTIHIRVIYDGEEHEIKTYRAEYRDLMHLLNNNFYLENFGECGGQGRCATCLVKISGIKGDVTAMERNEKTTIQKSGLYGLNIRLACQVLITNDMHNVTIEISNECY